MSGKVAVALSGGIDSSFAAYLLKKEGRQVEGFTLRLCPANNRCFNDEGISLARELCKQLDIPHHILDARKLFQKQIIDYFIKSYLAGLTPNPCVLCNALIKFGYLFEQINALGFQYLATGHYAGIEKQGETFFLKQAKDSKKSQDYFLSFIRPDILKRLIFPLANYTKDQVRKAVYENGILFHNREESQDICFINNQPYGQFIKQKILSLDKYKGNICHVNGKILGKHDGVYNFTYGQRAGLGIAWKEPLYVIIIDGAAKTVVVGEKEYLSKKEFVVAGVNWFSRLTNHKNIQVKIRYNALPLKCTAEVYPVRERSSPTPFRDFSLRELKSVVFSNGVKANKKIKVYLDEEAKAVTPGQIAAFYSGNILLCGGIIERTTQDKG